MKCWCDTHTAMRAASSQRPARTCSSNARSRMAMPPAMSPRNHRACPRPSRASADSPDASTASKATRADSQSARSIACMPSIRDSPAGSCSTGASIRPVRSAQGRDHPRADREQVLLLEARTVTVAAVPLVAEPVQRLVELGLPPLAGGVRPGGDRRPVVGLEVLGVVARALEGRDLEHVALERVELDAAAHERLQVLLAAPQRRGLGARGRRRHERLHRAEQRAEHALRGPAQQPDGAAGAA